MKIRTHFAYGSYPCWIACALLLAMANCGRGAENLETTTAEIYRMRVFEEPLIPVGGEPSVRENADLLTALKQYSARTSPDDFTPLTSFLAEHPKSTWSLALLTDLGLEYYRAARYSLALDAWERAWELGKKVTDAKGKALADRAVAELASMNARIGRMDALERIFKSVEGRAFVGPASEKIAGAREGLWTMQHKPEIAFRCGPLALHRIIYLSGNQAQATPAIMNAASTQKGFSLSQVAELSKNIGLNYQMAFRSGSAGFVVPSVVHWKVGHYAAIVRREGDLFLVEDPTFGNTVWASRAALEAESSGYFLIPSGALPTGWREVPAREGDTVWGKGNTGDHDKKKKDQKKTQGALQRHAHFQRASDAREFGGVGPAIGLHAACRAGRQLRDHLQQQRRLSARQFRLLQLRCEVDVQLDFVYH
jgi:hypothetical protein